MLLQHAKTVKFSLLQHAEIVKLFYMLKQWNFICWNNEISYTETVKFSLLQHSETVKLFYMLKLWNFICWNSEIVLYAETMKFYMLLQQNFICWNNEILTCCYNMLKQWIFFLNVETVIVTGSANNKTIVVLG